MRNQTILVDINKETCKILKYKQYDNNNILQIIVEENYKKINLNEYVGFAFFELPSGLIIKKGCEIEDNVITIIIDNNILSEEGKVLLDLTLSDGEDIFTLFRISLVIEETIDRDEAIIVEAGWDIVAEIAKFNKAEEQRVANEELRRTEENKRIANEQGRVTAENTRKTNEEGRVSAESTRKTNEEGRVSAEEQRIEDEELRQANESTRISKENTRQTKETERQTNEQGRVNAENTRKTNETSRVSAENTRIANEEGRVDAESTRQTNENTRVSNENTRKTNETNRQKAETSRVSAEQGRVDTEEQRIEDEELRQTNESTRQTNENTRVSNENTRKTNETSRVSAENTRIANEEGRVDAENTRKTNETSRATNEEGRVDAENTRKTNENTRISKEKERQTNETTRQNNESTRQNNENTRKTNETSRQNAEASRVSAENTRISNENTRKTNETSRVSAENTRISNENTRKTNETSRQNAEASRVSAEQQRVENEAKRQTLVLPSGGDDTRTIQNMLDTNKKVSLIKGVYNISSLTIPSGGQIIGAKDTTINATGDKAFYFPKNIENLSLKNFTIQTSKSTYCFYFDGQSGSVITDGVIEDVKIVGFTTPVYAKYLRKFNFNRISSHCKNFMEYTGKSAEVNINNSYLVHYFSTSTNSFGIKSYADGDNYPEGLMINNTLIYHFERNFDITDLFVGNFTNIHSDSLGSHCLPNRITHNKFTQIIMFDTCWFYFSQFVIGNNSATAGKSYKMDIKNCCFDSCKEGVTIELNKFACDVNISNCRFTRSADVTNCIGIVCNGSNNHINIHDLDFYEFKSYVQFKGSGARNSISNIPNRDDLETPFYLEHPVTTNNVFFKFNSYSISQGLNVSSGVKMINKELNLGEGVYVCKVKMNELNVSTGGYVALDIKGDNVYTSSGSGWHSAYSYIRNAEFETSYYFNISSPCKVTVTFKSEGAAFTVGYHSYMEIIKL